MNVAEVLLVVVVLALPLLLGAGAAMIRRPWWWAALVAVTLGFIAMVAPEPEPGESRLAAEDLGFVVLVLAVVVLIVWLGSLIGRWLVRNRPA
jgi:hypothetical protein